MNTELAQIRTLRKKYNLGQKELALRSGVSQSLIAKIESGTVEPTFGNAQRIFQALEQLQEKEQTKAQDLMNKKIICAKMSDSLSETAKIMKARGISQVPVLTNSGNPCGLITESTILDHLLTNPKSRSIEVGEIMEEVPPIISLQTGIKTILQLLHAYPILLVSEKGIIKGLITKSDLLGKI